MQVVLDPESERLVERELRAGRYQSAEEMVARALEALVEKEPFHFDPIKSRQAVKEMLELFDKRRLPLRGLRIRDLIHEGHKY